jgi:hypothetical protein
MAKISLFYSYAHEDEAFVRELEKQLGMLKRLGVIATWHDRQIQAGESWERAIDEQLASAQVILFMVSADFVASDYIWNREMTTALARHELGEAVVIPIVLREVAFLEQAPFAKLQMLPRDARPIVAWPRADEAWAQVAESIGAVCKDLQSKAAYVADAAEARRIYAQIAADMPRMRAEREAIMASLQEHIFKATDLNLPVRPRPSAMDAYIDTGDAPPAGDDKAAGS